MKALAILLLGFVLRVAIILTNPIIFGGDTMIRMADRFTLVIDRPIIATRAVDVLGNSGS